MMDILFHVTCARATPILTSLLGAAQRAGVRYAAFFTHDGVRTLLDPALRAALAPAVRAVVCEESWHRHCPDRACPVERGSQTANSELMGLARRVVSL